MRKGEGKTERDRERDRFYVDRSWYIFSVQYSILLGDNLLSDNKYC